MDDLSFLGEAVKNPVVVVVVIVVVLSSFISERAAKIAGPVGALGRWWGERQLRRMEREQAIEEARRRGESAQVAHLTAEVRGLTAEVRRLADVVDTRESLLVEWDLWAFDAARIAAANGVALPPPPRGRRLLPIPPSP
ncbi:hypothetical protein RHODO2019_10955 [Rhodococcus antarcticus]|uniref:Sec-independent protein translocase protein TatB n=1 Tax=Rhodococcus antarcticus TaxID=2987751 RepID=A0ABY6NXH9_9NOCA|nr:hypothetical protein [Rhodococcus antarcticus]UZJ23726.1 hypothetical protein RHODO2019_10955 [Rhodococcus antarcticus]